MNSKLFFKIPMGAKRHGILIDRLEKGLNPGVLFFFTRRGTTDGKDQSSVQKAWLITIVLPCQVRACLDSVGTTEYSG